MKRLTPAYPCLPLPAPPPLAADVFRRPVPIHWRMLTDALSVRLPPPPLAEIPEPRFCQKALANFGFAYGITAMPLGALFVAALLSKSGGAARPSDSIQLRSNSTARPSD